MDEITSHLWLTDIHGVQTQSTSDFSTVVTVCQDNVEDNVTDNATYHHFPLSDGPPPDDAYNPGEFSYELFATAVDTVIDAVTDGDTVLVHCHAGMSRSPMVIVAALTELHDLSFHDAETRVRDARPHGIQPSTELRAFARRYADTTDVPGTGLTR